MQVEYDAKGWITITESKNMSVFYFIHTSKDPKTGIQGIIFLLVHRRIGKVNIRNSHTGERVGVRTSVMTSMPCNFGKFLSVELGIIEQYRV
jgi:hypothetical protein